MADMEAEPQEVSADSGAMSDNELAALLAAHEAQAVGYYTAEIADEQALSIDYYYGRPFGDEQAGRSQVVDRTVAIVIDNAVSAILKPFVSTEDAVAFEPRNPEDEDPAKQATEYVNYVLNVDNPGFILLHNWFKAALLEKLGIVKVWWEDSERETITRMEGLDAQQVEDLIAGAGEDYEIIGGPYEDDAFYALDVKRHEADGRIKIVTVPSEEFRIAPYARDIESAEYVAHKPTNITRSDLIDMGLDPEVVDGLSAATIDETFDPRFLSRTQDENFASGKVANGIGNDRSRDIIPVIDEYVLVDFDGDGIAERRRIVRVDTEILINMEVDDNPFALLCPVPMPHKVYGLSLADQTRDLQRISSVLWRQMLDNLYLANNPKIEVGAAALTPDGATIDALVDPAPGGVVVSNQVGHIVPMAIPFVADKSFPMLEYAEHQQEARTGIGRNGQGLDTNALRKGGQMSATEAADLIAGKNSRAEMIARIFAETGVKRLFRLMLRLLVNHQPRERMIRLRNQWVTIDPRSWNAEMDMSISVGLGVGSKMEQIAQADSVIQTLAEVVQSPFGSLVGPEEAYHAIKRKLSAAGVKDVDNYLKDPAQQPPQQPQPDPEMVKVQAEMQAKQAEMQMKQQVQAADMQMREREGQLKIQLAEQEAAAKLELERAKAEQEAALAQQKFEFEAAMAERKMALEAELAREQADRQHEIAMKQADAKISSNRPGGDLDK